MKLYFLAAALLATTLARAAPRDVSAEIAALRPAIVSAELILMPPRIELRGYEGEPDMIVRGCHYTARDRSDIDSLIDVVAGAKLEVTPAPADEYIPLMLVRLHEGKREHTILLDQDYDNANASGEYRVAEHGTTSKTPIQAATKVERDLRFWASQHKSLAAARCAK